MIFNSRAHVISKWGMALGALGLSQEKGGKENFVENGNLFLKGRDK